VGAVWFAGGADGGLDVVAEGSEKFHEASDAEVAGTIAHEQGTNQRGEISSLTKGASEGRMAYDGVRIEKQAESSRVSIVVSSTSR